MSQAQHELAGLPAAPLVGGGITVAGLGTVVLVLSVRSSTPDPSSGLDVLTLLSALAVVAGLVMLTVGLTRVASKVDALYAMYVKDRSESRSVKGSDQTQGADARAFTREP